MFGNDLLLSFAFMAILFLRQIAILKQANKINYAPLMVGIGLISSIVHFIIHPEAQNFVHLLRESFFPLLVSLLLYIVMNIMHQTQEKENDKLHDEFSRIMVEQITQLKDFMSDLEGRLTSCQQDDRRAQEEIRTKFKEDIQALDSIQINQTRFLGKFDDMDEWHQKVSGEFEDFTDVQMPKLSSILHEHIDILRVSEQDHYNKIKTILEKAGDSRGEIAEDMDDVKESLKNMQGIADSIAQSITKHTLQQLSGVTKSFENEISSLKSHSEGINTSLLESDTTLGTIKEKSEIIMKQMLLSANRMKDLEEKNTGLHDVYTMLKELMADMEAMKVDYVKAQSQLSMISNELKSTENEQSELVRQQIEDLGERLNVKIDESILNIYEHFPVPGQDMTQSVQILAKKAQLQRGYTDLDS